MPYRPRVENRAGEIYARAIIGAANAEAAGIKEGAAGIAKGLKVAGVEFGEGIEKAGAAWQKNAAQKKADADLWSALNTKIETYGKMGYLTPRDADALSGIKKPNDLAAAMTVIEQDIGRRQQQQQAKAQQDAMFQRQYALEAMKQQQKAIEAQNSAKLGDTKVVVDPLTGEKTSWVMQNDGQMTPLNKSSKAGGVKKVELEPGKFIYQDQDGNTIDPKKIVEKTAPSDDIQTLKDEQARLAGQVAEGNKKPGPDWWPWSTSNADKLKGVTAQINTLEGGAQPQQAAAAQQPAAAPAQAYATKEDVQAAYKGGQLSREEAIKILQTQFEYQ